MCNNYFVTTHPKNGYDVTVEYDEGCKFINAAYSSDDEDVDITPVIKSHFQSDIDTYVKN